MTRTLGWIERDLEREDHRVRRLRKGSLGEGEPPVAVAKGASESTAKAASGKSSHPLPAPSPNDSRWRR